MWYSVAEAAGMINLSAEMTYRLCASGRLKHRRLGLVKGRGKIEVSDAAIEAFLKDCEVEGPAPAAPPKARRKPTPTFSGRGDGKPLKFDWS